VTLNSDDPSISGIDLAHEYRVAVEELGLAEADLRRMQETALAAAFLTSEEREEILAASGYTPPPVPHQRKPI
jgi:adenosine deaminase